MKNKTYNNFLKAVKLIEAKGYNRETAVNLAHNCFANCEANSFAMSVEWYINKILSADEYAREYCEKEAL